ncbi:MAG: hypothetical protein O7G88_01460 [bacterium]|nr:hypothetical protein [bacterium]
MTFLIQWDGEADLRHHQIIASANQDGFLSHALCSVFPDCREIPQIGKAILTPLATGGAMVVYKLSIDLHHQSTHHLVAKIPRDRRIVYAAGTERQGDVDTTYILFERLSELAAELDQRVPGLFPRCGGFWHRQQCDGPMQYVFIEEFIAGLSVERLKHHYEELLMAGQIDQPVYDQRLIAIQRLAVAAFIRLWDALGGQTFTSDPSPWNVLIRDPEGATPQPTIIDLHSLEENIDLTYVIQRMAAIYGNRIEIAEEVLLPGVIDALGYDKALTLLRETLPRLEANGKQSRRNLGVDLQQPLLRAIGRLK